LAFQEYALEKLDVGTVELKWGQGAKNIGGEVKITSFKEGAASEKPGYVVLPDPMDPDVHCSFQCQASFHEFRAGTAVVGM